MPGIGVGPSGLTAPASRLIPLPPRGHLQRVGTVGQPIAVDLPEEYTAEPLLHGPLGLDRDGLGIVVADHRRRLGRDEPRILGLIVPLAGPVRSTLELVEVGVIAARQSRP